MEAFTEPMEGEYQPRVLSFATRAGSKQQAAIRFQEARSSLTLLANDSTFLQPAATPGDFPPLSWGKFPCLE